MKNSLFMCCLYIAYFFILKYLFVKYVFVLGGEINPLYMFEENNVRGRKRQTYEKKLYNFKNSEKGKKLKKNLNTLTESFHEISAKAEIKIKKNVSENEHHKEIVQYIEFVKSKNNIKELLKDIKEAIKDVYSKGTTTIETNEEIENIKKDIKKKIEGQEELNESENEEEREERNVLNNKEELKNAIILDNIIKLLKSMRKAYTKEEYEKIINDEELLLEKILRPDAILDGNEFNKFYTGINLEGVNIPPTIKLPHIDYDETSASFLEMRDKSSPNYCSIYDKECDRRKHPDSCESRLEVEDQSGCGSCWVFSGLHSIELSHCMASGKDTVYSRQEILDCSERECKGGYLGNIAAYLHKYKRLADDGSYPYEATKVYCRSSKKENVWTGDITEEYSREESHVLQRNAKSEFTDDEWNTFIKKIVVKHGAVVVYLGADDLRYIQGVPIRMCQTWHHTNHAVIITGWKILAGVPVWIIRNSWGNWWSDKGYAYVAIENNCRSGFFPIHKIHVGKLGEYSDKIDKYRVINTNTRGIRDKSLKSIGIDIGVEKTIECQYDERIHIRKYHTVSYHRAVSNEKQCEKLDIKNKCENQHMCRIYFLPHVCDPFYELLYVEYECLKGVGPFDCTKSTTSHPDITDATCVSYCRSIAPTCSPVTKECLYRTVDRHFCNFEAVPRTKEQQEEAQRRQRELDIQRRRREEEIERRQRDSYEQRKRREEDAQRRQGEEDAQRRQREEDEQRRQREEDEQRRQREEDEQRRQREEDEQRRQREEDEQRRQREEDEQRRQIVEDEQRRYREEDAQRRQREEDAQRRQREEDAQRRQREEDTLRRYREDKQTNQSRRRREAVNNKFDCTKAVTKLNSNNQETCINECRLYKSECSTTDCFYNRISKDKCDLTDVVNGLDCSKVEAVGNPGNTSICISHCEYYTRECSTVDCLKEKIPSAYCNLSNVVQGIDCNKARALFIPDSTVTNFCIEHCEYYSNECTTLECLYSSISDKICDLNKIV